MTSRNPMTHPPFSPCCSIVPPYLLDAVTRAGDTDLKAVAEQTLHHDHELRTTRTSTTAARAASGPQDGYTTVHRDIYDAGNSTTLPGSEVRAEGAAPTSDVAVNEAYDGLGDTWTFYDEVFNRNSIDGRGLGLIGTVHYGRRYDNAFWNGEQMVFGDGDGTLFGRFTASVDVIGHELTHGVTQSTANLVYSDQPGALNESISDVFGVLVKQRTLGQTADQADWLIGAGLLMPGVQGRALRDMLHPGTAYDDPRLGKDPQPADMAHYVQTTSDNGGVHINSGIPNRAFALAATTIGGEAWKGAGQVWYDVLTGSQITAQCDFATFAQLTVDAATSRFGASSAQADAIRKAWATVGVLGGGTAATPRATQSAASDPLVRVGRSGGFAGIVREATVRLADLPDPDAATWRSLLGSGAFQEFEAAAPAESPVRDDFCYTVSCPAHDVDASLSGETLPDHVRDLLERTLTTGRPTVE
ncbi:MAG TPA: protealysin inhibitor emfourin [Propionibacteriaceae bacterium]|nr:protealysin inhibitor emfourin [Propionibacteriaceae bacterium]